MSFLNFFRFKKPSQEIFDALEDILIQGDIGADLSHHLVQMLLKKTYTTFESFQETLADEISKILQPFSIPLDPSFEGFILIVGVNGSGKTTTIAKLGALFPSVAFVAGDTFRAAAKEQLQLWGKHLNIPVYSKEDSFDPAALVYEVAKNAPEKVIIVDTAGRLQTHHNLMDEIVKIKRVLAKAKKGEPKECLLIVDGTVGQNALSQVQHFHEKLGLSGLIMTKLDGTARGGILLNLVSTYKIPIKGVTFGENAEAFSTFDCKAFSRKLIEKITL